MREAAQGVVFSTFAELWLWSGDFIRRFATDKRGSLRERPGRDGFVAFELLLHRESNVREIEREHRQEDDDRQASAIEH
ncbi:MAG TPA: hypothetical protein VFO89_13805 [Thermoanaerobaculia bacterium]|nr:hypothetical protein [Thermoanaerobaculia bacterium]